MNFALFHLLNFFYLSKSDRSLKKSLKNILGFAPGNLSLYKQSFLHSSKKQSLNNERMEFLGDAVLGSIVAEYLFKIYPYKDEGFLTQLRSKIVNRQTLKLMSLKFGVNVFLKTDLNKNEKERSSAYGDAFEALIGAIYLDKGFLVCKKFVIERVIKNHIDLDELVNNESDYKSKLQIMLKKINYR